MVEYSKLQNGSDIRGVALPLVAAEPVNLTEEAAGQIGRAFAAWPVSYTHLDVYKRQALKTRRVGTPRIIGAPARS